MQRNMADVQREANLEQQEQIQATLVDQTDSARGAQFCIPGIHSTTTSEPATTEEHSKLDVSGLKERYKKLFSPEYTDDPQSRIPYIQLALVKGEKDTKANEKITKLRLQGQVDELLLEKEPLSGLRDIFHYKNKHCPRVILIMGGSGIGKTTLCQELCLNWAGDGFLAEDFKVVVFIPLYTVQDTPLKNVVVECIGEDNYQELEKSKGSKCLIILDGFDEMKRLDDPFLSSLIRKYTIFEKATILITSRPHVCEKIDAGRIIEVVGFEKDKIEEFVQKYFPDDIQSVKFLQQLDKYQLYSLCYIPMNLDMLVKIFYHSKELPSTLTELYKLFLAMTLHRQVEKPNVAKNPAILAETVPDYVKDELKRFFGDKDVCIPTETVGIVWCLSRLAYQGFFNWFCHKKGEDDCEELEKRLAYRGFFDCYCYKESVDGWKELKEPKIIFSESDLKDCDIEVTSDFDGFGLLKATPIYGLTKNTNTNAYNFNHLTIQEFLCAVYISLQSQQEQLHLLRKHFHEYPNVFTFVCGLTGLASSEMCQFVYSKLTLPWGNPDVITAMRCVNESKQSSGPHQLVSPFTLDMTWDALLPYECVCVSHVLSCYPVLALGMSGCYIGSKGAEQLVKHYNNLAGQILEELDLQYNYLTSEGMEHVMKIVRTSKPMLKGLDVSYNVIGDNGMEIISKELQHNKSLTTLRVVWCGLSVKVYISQLLNVTHTLQVLYMSYNNISDDGMTAINKSLTTLMVPECGLSLKGANSISKIMMVNHSLQELLMSENNIGDDGISAIAGALAALSSNHTTRKLWLMDNAITVEGTLLMVKSAVHNTVCQELEIDNKYYENDEVKKILEDRERQHESLQQLQITESIMENNNNSSNDKESVHELPGDGATVGLNEDDHSRGQEETREHHHKQASSSNQSCCLLL